MKYCIIGGGCFGIYISKILLSKGNQVTLITETLESVSYLYSRGIIFEEIKLNFIKNIFFKMKNYNYIWLLLTLIQCYSSDNEYQDYKKYAFRKSIEIIKSFDLNLNYDLCKKKYTINIPIIFKKIIDSMKNDNNFKLIQNTSYNHNDIKKLAEEKDYHYVFDCRGTNNKLSYLTENIGGYMIEIECDHELCFTLEDGWYLHSNIENKNILVAKGGWIVGSKRYENKLNNDKNLDEMEKIKKNIKSKPFWKKYNCKKILSIRYGSRQYSNDLIPFYSKSNNIISINGGSGIGCILAPYTCNCIIDDILYNKVSKYEFSIKRPQKAYLNSIKYIVLFFVFLFLLKRNFKPIVKRYTGIKL